MKKIFVSSIITLISLMSMTTVPTTTTFKVDAAKSSFKWTGKKLAGTHWGYVKFTDGSLQIQKGALVGGTYRLISCIIQFFAPQKRLFPCLQYVLLRHLCFLYPLSNFLFF